MHQCGQSHEDDGDGLDDRELPDETDMDPEDDDTPDGIEPCPYCKKGIYEDSEFCPHCGQYLSHEDQPWSKPAWMVIIVAALVFSMLMFYIMWPG